jgi:cobyrinic acid a,c-diamide synthase
MSRCGVKQTLVRSVAASELAIVEGQFTGFDGRAVQNLSIASPVSSSLDTLCEWLDLPRVAIVDVSSLSLCQLPLAASHFDGILLDRVKDAASLAYWQTQLEALYGAPVVGHLDEASQLRALCDTSHTCKGPTPDLCAALGRRLVRTLDVERLLGLACRPPPLAAEVEPFVLHACPKQFRIAVAYDDAFCGYYPETLDLLEAAGAELCDFSPLASESLPSKTDIVYVGCGHPEQFAERLAGNHCLKQSLRAFAARGGRVYAQGGGLAYLCRDIELGGETIPMTGLLPATARWQPQAAGFEPVEVMFGERCWMMPHRRSLRGYRHNGWQIEPRGAMISYALDAGQRLDFLGRGNVIGSRVLIDLAANRHLLAQFFEPSHSALQTY